MRHGRGFTRFSRFVLAAVMLLAGIGVGAGAMVGAQSATIYYACVNNSSGTIKMVAASTTCGNNEVRVEWNQQGPAGVPGAAGPAGANGLDGVSCWDLDADRIEDSEEDVNEDGVFNALDCQGPQGEQGPTGETNLPAIEEELAALQTEMASLQEQLRDITRPRLSIDDVARLEGNSGQTSFVFTVSLSHASDSDVTVDYATGEGTALAGSDYIATSGTLTFAPGETSKEISVSVIGDSTVESDESFSVTLSNATNATLADGHGLGTILNDDSVPALSINDVTRLEGNIGQTTFVFTATLSHSIGSPVSVQFATVNGTALAGSDYIATSGTLTFAPGQSFGQINVQVLGDVVAEPHETFSVLLTNPTNATLADAEGVGTILNDDSAPTMSIDDVTKLEGTGGQTPFAFTVTLSHASSSEVTVQYATADGTALAGSDYITTSGTLTFAPGQTSRQIVVAVNGDSTAESHETFSVLLTNPANATLADGQGMGTIQNDDLPRILITNAQCNEVSTCVFSVQLSGPTHETVEVTFATQNGSAAAGTDYQAKSGTVVFSPGQTQQEIHIVTLADGVVIGDGPEHFYVNLTSPVNATLQNNQAQGTIYP